MVSAVAEAAQRCEAVDSPVRPAAVDKCHQCGQRERVVHGDKGLRAGGSISLGAPCIIYTHQLGLELGVCAVHGGRVHAQANTALGAIEELAVLHGDAFPAALEEDVVCLRVEHALCAEADGCPALWLGVVADEGSAGAHEGETPVVFAAVGGEFGEEGGDHVWFAEGVAADDSDVVAHFEAEGAGAALVDEEAVAVIEDAHVSDTAVLCG